MEIYPAIDLLGGRCVRLQQGRFDTETVYSDDPVQTALRWQEEGARWLHVVDLDGARRGRPQQLDIVERITDAVRIPVQVGGGMSAIFFIDQAFRAGAARVVVGTAVVSDPKYAQKVFFEFGNLVVLGVDARDGKVAIRGWQEQTEIDALQLIQQMAEFGARRVIYTDIARDGMLTGVNLEALRVLVREAGIPVIASGGVASLDDLVALKEIGVEGVIIGQALYTGAIRLREALEKVG